LAGTSIPSAYGQVDASGLSYRYLSPSSARYHAFGGSGFKAVFLPTGPSGIAGSDFIFSNSGTGLLTIYDVYGSSVKTVTGSGNGTLAFAVWNPSTNAYWAF
jgi:hypothetical protein